MEKLEEYLAHDYLKEKEMQKLVLNLINDVIPTYKAGYKDKLGFRYEIREEEDSLAPKFSASTNAMLVNSLNVLLGEHDIVRVNHQIINNQIYIKDNLQETSKMIQSVVEMLLKEFTVEKKISADKTKEANSFYSTTFGDNDPFTLLWISNILFRADGKETDINSKWLNNQDALKQVNNLLIKSLLDVDNNTQKPIVKNHMFPLLKKIQLFRLLKDAPNGILNDKKWIKQEKIFISSCKEKCENILHTHLSLESIENSNFDTAELVFALEGLLLLDLHKDDNEHRVDKNLLKRLFTVVNQRQNISHYWRPLKPFVSNQQGLALLPLSVEIAMSLIRICELLNKQGEKLFSEYYEMFKKYTEWIRTRVNVVSIKGQNYYGWCSEHVYEPNVIHPWETSQVMIYLTKFNQMLQKHIAYKSLKYANLSINDELKNDTSTWENNLKLEPVNINPYDVYSQINKKYISTSEDRNYSMLLSGPPGTGKSTIAENIAKTKCWELITITPSDFVVYGAEKLETRAKSIFRVLEEQQNKVILFDEIDRLILDRDTKFYEDQSDLFQLMTPSMLVKIKDLRNKEKVIFVIATNYSERIDLAIKRKGRIDNEYIVLPHNYEGRKNVVLNILSNKKWSVNKEMQIIQLGGKETRKDLQDYDTRALRLAEIIAKETVLYSYTEIKTLLEELKGKSTLIEEEIIREEVKSNPPTISLNNYRYKIGTTEKEKNIQKPTREFILLVYLKCELLNLENREQKSIEEAKTIFDEKELNLILQLVKSEDFNLQNGSELREKFKQVLTKYVSDIVATVVYCTLLEVLEHMLEESAKSQIEG